MTVSSISGSQSLAYAQRADNGQSSMRKAFDAAAKALGMSTDDLRGALGSGQSMSTLAQSKGVSTDTLTTAISDALTSADSTLSATKAKEVAQKVVAGPGHGGGPGGPGGARPAGPPPGGGGHDQKVDDALDSVADALGLSSEELQDELRSGTSLTDVAAANGMDAATLKTTITDALKAGDDSLSDDQVDALADKIIEGPPKPDDTTPRQAFDLAMSARTQSAGSISQAALSALYQQSQLATAGSATGTWA
ncbi:hypothetical protein V5P93_004669 [Actinokineospora auranticolor]|uniref:Uncharacterized protein n=1 Tax=Actinokineospora auranticolor TaxID=155976 RepID=A0A2S6GN27_9PSEU|nr:hypothetical protein [Actinokineospora auranticolor]PPK66628.1 hypothetical protein CLV40_10913 [Actinokineospora auranticolor]